MSSLSRFASTTEGATKVPFALPFFVSTLQDVAKVPFATGILKIADTATLGTALQILRLALQRSKDEETSPSKFETDAKQFQYLEKVTYRSNSYQQWFSKAVKALHLRSLYWPAYQEGKGTNPGVCNSIIRSLLVISQPLETLPGTIQRSTFLKLGSLVMQPYSALSCATCTGNRKFTQRWIVHLTDLNTFGLDHCIHWSAQLPNLHDTLPGTVEEDNDNWWSAHIFEETRVAREHQYQTE